MSTQVFRIWRLPACYLNVVIGSAVPYWLRDTVCHNLAIKIPIIHILSPLPGTTTLVTTRVCPAEVNPPLARQRGIVPDALQEVADEEDAVADQLDFTQQANDCFRLAESETQSEIKTILMGMAYGWLTFANRHKVTSEGHRAPVDEPTEEPADDLN